MLFFRASFADYPPLRVSPELIRGHARAVNFELGFGKEVVAAEKASLAKIANDFSLEIEALKRQQSSAAKTWSTFQDDCSKSIDGCRANFSDVLTDVKKQFASIEAQYREHMRLKSPVEYWRSKALRHSSSKIRWLVWTFVCGVFSVTLLFGIWAGLQNYFPIPSPPTTQDLVVALTRNLSLLAMAITGCVWCLRVLVRIYLTHVHLENDANERVVMAETYLALTGTEAGSGRIQEDKDRQIVLQALFRHAADGIVSDDALPELFADIARKVK